MQRTLATRKWYPTYALTILFIVYVFNFIDRSILNILAQSVKEDLGLYDWQIGLMGGIAFALFYTTFGIPIARLADTHNRRNILAVCLAVWSAMTAVCGLAQNFWHMLLARVGVAVGEAGGSPPAHSMISDLFAADRRATALGIYALGIPVGTMLGNLAGGWINEVMDWRTAFIVVGLPGILMALVVRFTLVEPPRGYSEEVAKAKADAPPVGFVFKALWSRKSFRYMALGGALHALVGYGVGPFIPPLFIRVHEMGTAEIGMALFWLGFAGIAGTASGGYIADRLAARDVRWYVWLPGIATLISVPFSTIAYVWPEPIQAFWIMAPAAFLGAYYLGPTPGPDVFARAGSGRHPDAGARRRHPAVHPEPHRDGHGSGDRGRELGSAERLYGSRRRVDPLGAGGRAGLQRALHGVLSDGRQGSEERPRPQSRTELTAAIA